MHRGSLWQSLSVAWIPTALLAAGVLLVVSLVGCSGNDCGPEPVVPAECVVVSRGECGGQDVWFCNGAEGPRCLTSRGTLQVMCPVDASVPALDASTSPDAR